MLEDKILLERKPYWDFDVEKITFDSERYRKDFREDLYELLGIDKKFL